MHKESIACRAQKLREQLARLDTIDQACKPTAQQEAIEEKEANERPGSPFSRYVDLMSRRIEQATA